MQRLDTQDDAELLTEFAAKGSHAAFAVLVNRHGPLAHGIAMRVLSSHHDAQDVTQAVFILLARDAKKLASSPSVAGWIHTVTRRLALNAHNSRARRQRREHTAMEHATTTAPLNSAQEAPFRRELDAAIARLPERYRQPLLLVHLEGAPMDEVAKRLALHPDTLRMRLSRARVKLRELLGQRGVEIASVTVLSSFLTNELQASSAFSPQLASTILHGAIGGASVSPHVLALTAKGAISTSISLSAITLLMKTKTTIIATVVTLAAIGGAALQMSKHDDSTTITSTAMPALDYPRTSQSRKARESSAKDPLAELSNLEIHLLFKKITILADDERLTRLRKDLGMDISDEAYRKAIAAYGYQIDTQVLFEELMKQWSSEDPRAATLWFSSSSCSEYFKEFNRLSGYKPVITRSLAKWLLKDKAAATAWAEGHIAAADEDPLPLPPPFTRNRPSLLIDALQVAEFMHQSPKPVSKEKLYERTEELYLLSRAPKGTSPLSPLSPLTPERSRALAELGVLEDYWADYEPGAAVKMSATAKPRDSTDIILERIQRWAQLDPDAALQWAKEAGKDNGWLDLYLQKILPSWQIKHPDKSIRDVADLSVMSDDRYYESLIEAVAKSSASVNGKAAMDLAAELTEPRVQLKTMADIIETWSLKSPVEVEQWIAAAPAGIPQDTAMFAYAKTAGSLTDIGSTVKLVREIGNPRIKLDAADHSLYIMGDLTIDLPQALELTRELSVFHDTYRERLLGIVNAEDEPALRAWIDQAQAEGKIKEVSIFEDVWDIMERDIKLKKLNSMKEK